MVLFISSCCKLLKKYLSGKIYACATWGTLFSSNPHPHNWFMPTTVQLENVYYYKSLGFHFKTKKIIYMLENSWDIQIVDKKWWDIFRSLIFFIICVCYYFILFHLKFLKFSSVSSKILWFQEKIGNEMIKKKFLNIFRNLKRRC